MSALDCVEVYRCNRGEKVADVSPEVRNDIPDKQSAREDGIKQCKSDEAIEKIYYYGVGEDGESKLLLTYENPHWKKMVDDVPAESEGAKSNSSKQSGRRAGGTKAMGSASILQTLVDRLFFEDATPSGSSGAPAKKGSKFRRAAEFVLFE